MKIELLTLAAVHTFVTVAEELHFTRAAARLHVAQPALTKRIQQLERILGVSRVRFEYGTAGLGEPARLRSDGEVEWRHQVWDVDHRGLPTGVDIELLAESRGRLTGRYLMRANPDSRPTRSERLVALTLAGQVGAAAG